MYVYDEKSNEWIRRSQTAEYQRRKRLLRDAWIAVAIIMLALPLAGMIAVALFSTFISFMYLDESDYGSYERVKDS